MPQIIDVPGQGQVEFPDGMTDGQIIAAIKLNASQPPQTVTGELGRQLGLTARAGITGLAALPNMVADPLVGLYNRMTGSQVPSFAQRQDQALTNLGLPQPRSSTERVVQAGTQALVPIGGVAKVASMAADSAIPSVLGALKYAPAPNVPLLADNVGTQAISGLLGSSASEAAKEGGAGPTGQLALGLLAGVGGPTALSAANVAARAAFRVPGSLLSPFTQEGRSNVVAGLYQRSAGNPSNAAAKIANAADYVPGVLPTTADVGQDNGLSALYKALINRNAAAFADRNAANDATRQAFLSNAFGNESDLNAAKAARDAQTRPLREQALGTANDTTRQILALQNDVAQKAASKAQALQQYGQMATGAAEQQTFANNFTPVPGMPRVPGVLSPNQELVPTYQAGAQDAAQIAAQRQAEREAAQSQLDAIPYTPLQTAPILNSIRGTLNAPGIRASDVATGTLSDVQAKLASLTGPDGTIDARDLYTVRKELGNTIQKNAKESNNWDKRMTAGLERDIQGAMDNAIVGSGGTSWPDYLRQYSALSKNINSTQTGQDVYKAGLTTQDRLSQPQFSRAVANRADEISAMTPQDADAIMRVNQDLKRSAAALNSMRTAGSDTTQNLIGADMLNNTVGRLPFIGKAASRVGSLLYAPLEAKTQSLALNAMLDPALGRAMLTRPIPQKPDLIAQLLASRFPITYGGLLGVMGGQ